MGGQGKGSSSYEGKDRDQQVNQAVAGSGEDLCENLQAHEVTS